jgi:hypothetical protein
MHFLHFFLLVENKPVGSKKATKKNYNKARPKCAPQFIMQTVSKDAKCKRTNKRKK